MNDKTCALKWNNVNIDLPEYFVSVLVYMPTEAPLPTVREGYLASDGVWVAGGIKRESLEVTKWAPMPEPPEEE